jgi:hypothetical protein
MQPTLVHEPFHRPGWVYEEKVDGWRIVAHKDGQRVRLVSRQSVDPAQRFPEVAAAILKLSARTLVLDGEVAIYDEELRSRFDWLREPDPDAVATPPLFMVFDIVHRTAVTRPRARCVIAVPDWRTSSLAADWSSPFAGSRQMAMRRGGRCSSAATRATSPSTGRARTKLGARGGG